VRENNFQLTRVGIADARYLPFDLYQDGLSALGYDIQEYNPDSASRLIDICILPIQSFQSGAVPLLTLLEVYDIPFIVALDEDSATTVLDRELHKAVGFFCESATPEQLALKIQMGLQWHSERKQHSRRVEDVATKIQNNRDIGIATGLLMVLTHMGSIEVFDKLKSFSRNNQVRIATVAKHLILMHEQKDKAFKVDGQVKDLDEWLANALNTLLSSVKRGRNL
jgi:hypothetical protein